MFWYLRGGWPTDGLTVVDPVFRRFSEIRTIHDISFHSIPRIGRHGPVTGNLLSAWLSPELKELVYVSMNIKVNDHLYKYNDYFTRSFPKLCGWQTAVDE